MRMGSISNDLRQRLAIVGCTFLAPLAVVVTTFAMFAATVLNFENLRPGTTVTTQFSAQGVTFQSAFIGTDLGARSGTRALRTISPSAEVFTPIPLKMEFVRSQRRVKLFATSPGIPRN